jgi:hypothetical protein
MEQDRNVAKNLKIVDWKPKRETDWSLGRLSLQALSSLIGERAAGGVAQVLGGDGALARLRLDGLVSVWQGAER